MNKKPIVFIHGLWLHASSWEPWMQFFSQQGYTCYNPGWPGTGDTVAASRNNAKDIANRSIKEVADSYATFISTLPEPPIVIGHSFGGLMVQLLLDRGVAVAGVAIDPAPIKGVWQLPLTVLRASLPVIWNPFHINKAVSLTYGQFRYAFTNALSESESRDLYDRFTVPSPARPLFQAAMATLNPRAESKVNVTKANRGPLLITAGEKDHIVPPLLSQAAAKLYRKSSAVTELVSFPNRGHSLALDSGWQELAEYSLEWLEGRGF